MAALGGSKLGTASDTGGMAASGLEIGEGGISATSAAHKLRTGEIDPHPETKPVRPNPIDMEMVAMVGRVFSMGRLTQARQGRERAAGHLI